MRQHFQALSNKAYFNYGGQGPLSQPALDAILNAYDRVQREGPFSGRVNRWVAEQVEKTRNAIAAGVGVPPDTMTLTEDVSVGCNIPMWGLDWQPGEHLLLTDCEHPGIVASAHQLQKRFGIEISIAPVMDTLNGGDPVDAIAPQLRANTRLVVLSHILWNTGQVLPLERITTACGDRSTDRKPIRVLVDAAQSVGVLPLQLADTGVDFYAFTGHKWWCGPEGVGGLYISREAREDVQPTFIGWRGITKDESGHPTGWKPDGRRFEIATSAYPLYAGLEAAIALHDSAGTAGDRYRQICEGSAYLWEQLAKIPQVQCLKTSPPESGLVSFQIESHQHKALVEFLEDRDIMARTILDPNCTRACVHYFTTTEEMDRLVAGVAEFCQSQ